MKTQTALTPAAQLAEKQKQHDAMLAGMAQTYAEHCAKVLIWRRANGCGPEVSKWGAIK